MNAEQDLFEMLFLSMENLSIQGAFALDICGTGGDGKNTFNISTAAAIVCATVGCKVVKHCGEAVTGNSGSSDVLKALGYNFHEGIETFNRTGFCAIHSVQFNPLLSALKKPRRTLGRPTIINQLAPLLNPARPAFRVMGTTLEGFTRETMTRLKSISERAWLISAVDGSDEVSTSCTTMVADTYTAERNYSVHPEEWGYKFKDDDALKVSSPEESANVIREVFVNRAHPQQKAAVILNAAAGICVRSPGQTYADAVTVARYAIESGMVWAKWLKISGGWHK